MGSNSKYKTDYLVTLPCIAVKYGKLTNTIAAKELNVSERTIVRWRKGHAEFNNAMSDPLGSALGKNYERVIGNMTNGRTVTERDEYGNVVKETTHSPTHQDLILPKNMGYMITNRYEKNQAKEEVKKERRLMKHWIDKYNNNDINLSQLLTEYYNEAVEPPPHFIKEHAVAISSGTLDIVAEEDTYDQTHAAKILAAKQERQRQHELEIKELAKLEMKEEIDRLKAELKKINQGL